MRERIEAKILCVLKSPKSEGAPFGVSVYAVGEDKPRRILEAVSPRSELLGFLGLVQEGMSTSEHMPAAISADSCV